MSNQEPKTEALEGMDKKELKQRQIAISAHIELLGKYASEQYQELNKSRDYYSKAVREFDNTQFNRHVKPIEDKYTETRDQLKVATKRLKFIEALINAPMPVGTLLVKQEPQQKGTGPITGYKQVYGVFEILRTDNPNSEEQVKTKSGGYASHGDYVVRLLTAKGKLGATIDFWRKSDSWSRWTLVKDDKYKDKDKSKKDN